MPYKRMHKIEIILTREELFKLFDYYINPYNVKQKIRATIIPKKI